MQRVMVLLLFVAVGNGISAYGADILPSHGYLAQVPLEILIRNPEVREEIGLTESQYQQARELMKASRQDRIDTFRQTRELGLSNDEASQYLTDKSEKRAASVAETLKTILQTKQHERLQQIVFHHQLRFQGVLFLQLDSIVKTLDLSEDELARWRIALREQHERHSTELKKLGDETVSNVYALLPDEKRRAFEVYFGEPYRGGDLPTSADSELTPWGPLLGLLRDAGVRRDLEIIDAQQGQVEELLSQIQSKYNAARSTALRNRDDKHAGVVLQAELAQLREAGIPRVKEILLPHQLKRLEQLMFQSRVQEQSGEPLRSELVAKALKLSESERTALLEKMDEERKDMKAKADKLWNDVLKSSIELLTVEQQARYYRLVGKAAQMVER